MKKLAQITTKGWIFLFFALGVFAYIMVGCQAEPPENSRAAQISRGEALFKEKCAVCHGEKGKGDGVQADSLEVKPLDLTKIGRRRGGLVDVQELARIIDGRQLVAAHGSREMPVWGEVFEEQEGLSKDELKGKLGELIAYLASIQE